MDPNVTIVTAAHIEYAASLLGTKLLSSTPTQALIESNQSYIDRFDVHEINRNVDRQWVAQMKMEIMKTIMASECMTLTLAIDERLIKMAMSDSDNQDNQDNQEFGGFRAIILDGQHRIAAMKEIMREMPSTTFKMWLIVYLVKDDLDIKTKLEAINLRRTFSQADTDKVAVTMNFLTAFERATAAETRPRRCLQRVRKSAILKSEAFVAKHRTTTVAEFETKIRKSSTDCANGSNGTNARKSAVNCTVAVTGLYQLFDASCSWLNDL